MRTITVIGLLVVALVGLWSLVERPGMAAGQSNQVVILDNCEPSDPGWAPTGGCTLNPNKGDVTAAEFFDLLFSPLGPGGILIGHPSWRNDPSYLSIREGRRVQVKNRGGRAHTFTEVEDFGGGFIPPLNGGLAPALACLDMPTTIEPGGRERLAGLEPGLHKFQCCIHPWMRAAIRVE